MTRGFHPRCLILYHNVVITLYLQWVSWTMTVSISNWQNTNKLAVQHLLVTTHLLHCETHSMHFTVLANHTTSFRYRQFTYYLISFCLYNFTWLPRYIFTLAMTYSRGSQPQMRLSSIFHRVMSLLHFC